MKTKKATTTTKLVIATTKTNDKNKMGKCCRSSWRLFCHHHVRRVVVVGVLDCFDVEVWLLLDVDEE